MYPAASVPEAAEASKVVVPADIDIVPGIPLNADADMIPDMIPVPPVIPAIPPVPGVTFGVALVVIVPLAAPGTSRSQWSQFTILNFRISSLQRFT